MAKLLLTDRYLRMDPEIEAWNLDDIEHLVNLKALATRGLCPPQPRDCEEPEGTRVTRGRQAQRFCDGPGPAPTKKQYN